MFSAIGLSYAANTVKAGDGPMGREISTCLCDCCEILPDEKTCM
jgi:hypothetical protein